MDDPLSGHINSRNYKEKANTKVNAFRTFGLVFALIGATTVAEAKKDGGGKKGDDGKASQSQKHKGNHQDHKEKHQAHKETHDEHQEKQHSDND